MEKDVRIVMVGAGNLGTCLAKALYKERFNIVQVYSRTPESARCLAMQVGASYTHSLSELTSEADLYITALKDDALLQLIPHLTRGREEALWVHTAGSVPMSVWDGYAGRYGVFYPMQTFSKAREPDFDQIPVFLEADSEESLALLHEMAGTLSRKVYHANSEQRQSLHLAAVFTCNFANHTYALAERLLAKYRLPFDVMLPLIDETAQKVHTILPGDAQTGPAIRGDEGVMAKHRRMLADEPRMLEIYEMMSKNIQNMKK